MLPGGAAVVETGNRVEPGDEVRERLTRAARASLDAEMADAWLAMLMPGTRLRAVPVPAPVMTGGGSLSRLWRHGREGERREHQAVVGWLGGLPFLPVGSGWPWWGGHGPLAHIATVDCAQLQPALPARLREAGFPDAGWLSFFYFDGSADGGIEVVGALFPGTAGGARVLYAPAGQGTEVHPPEGLTPYPKVEVTAEPVLTWPTWEHPRLYAGGRPAAGWDDDELYAVVDAIRQEQQAPPAHQVGGHPDPVQGPVELEVAYGQLSRSGQDKITWTDPAVIAAADDWILLGQFDTDSQAGFMWGDGGVLYYLIRPADLAARRFDEAAFTWQCS